MHDDALADFGSGGEMLFERTESLIADSQRRRKERDEVWAFHLGNRVRVSALGRSLLIEAVARIESCERPSV